MGLFDIIKRNRKNRRQRIRHESEAVSSLPSWLPEGAITFIDFKNGHYYFGGTEHTRAETVEENTDWGTFDAGKIVNGVGLRNTGTANDFTGAFALTAAAKVGLLPNDGGVTAVITYALVAGADCAPQLVCSTLDLPDFNQEWSFTANKEGESDSCQMTDFVGVLDSVVYAAAPLHKVAFTFEPTHFALSVDGAAATALAGTPASNASATDICFAAHITSSGNSATATIESIALYASKLDAALAGLSA